MAGSALEPFEARVEALAPHITVALPEGPGPFPAVVQLHGCGGRKAFQDRWASVARSVGVAGVVVDSFAHRAIGRLAAYSTVCTALRLRGAERAGDLYAALEWVRRQAWADPARLGIAGWSHGGWTALDALTLTPGEEMGRATGLIGLPEAPFDGVQAAFLVYPYCGRLCLARDRELRVKPRTTAVLAGADRVVGWQTPKAALERQAGLGLPLQLEVLPNATHAFDEEDARDLRTRFNPEATARAETLYRELLGELTAPKTRP